MPVYLKHVFKDKTLSMQTLLAALGENLNDSETLRLQLQNKTPLFGNDEDAANSIMQQVFNSLFHWRV